MLTKNRDTYKIWFKPQSMQQNLLNVLCKILHLPVKASVEAAWINWRTQMFKKGISLSELSMPKL